MDWNPCREANGFSDNLEMSRTLWNHKARRVHKDAPLVRVLSQINPDHTFPCYLFKIPFNITLQSIPRLSRWSLSFRFTYRHTIYKFLLPDTCHICRNGGGGRSSEYKFWISEIIWLFRFEYLIFRRIYGPKYENGEWKSRTNREL